MYPLEEKTIQTMGKNDRFKDEKIFTVLTAEEVRERRKYFLTKAHTKTVIKKGDKRVLGERLCAICVTPLSVTALSTQQSMAVRDHYHCYFSELMQFDICKDSTNCQRVHKKHRESE